jgi:hypothetical protein
MDIETLKRACEEYKTEEGRASFYDVALEIADAYPLQASIILLAVWNTARFRFMASDRQNLNDLQNAIAKCKPLFNILNGKNFKTVNFDEIKDTVKRIYSTLSRVKGVEYTGASKVMHLANRDLFVMWDRKTREKYGYYVADKKEYLSFLKQMQGTFGDIEWDMPNKTLAKAIDEYNQATITIPKRQKRKVKK